MPNVPASISPSAGPVCARSDGCPGSIEHRRMAGIDQRQTARVDASSTP